MTGDELAEAKKVLQESFDYKNPRSFFDTLKDLTSKYTEKKNTIVQNTFQENKDGTKYGTDKDGLTYSYRMGNKGAENFQLLSADDQKQAISDLSGGKIKIDNSIKNQKYLTQIHRSLNRMYNYGNGNLVPQIDTIVDDPNPGRILFTGSKQTMGYASPRDWYGDNNKVSYVETDYPDEVKRKTVNAVLFGHNAGSPTGEDAVQTHEMAHIADFDTTDGAWKWAMDEWTKAEELKNKYPADKLFLKAIMDLQGKDFELDPESHSVGAQISREVEDRYNKFYDTYGDKFYGRNMLKNAAEKLGFESVKEAAETISEYAAEDHLQTMADEEIFAEAYTDVLLNGDDAAAFSKEVVRAYAERADALADFSGRTKEKRMKEFKELFEVPILDKTNNDFASQVARSKALLKIGGKK